MLYSHRLNVVLCLAFVASTTLANITEDQAVAEVIIRNDLSNPKYISEGAELIPLSQFRSTRGAIIYTLGIRVADDRLVSKVSGSESWTSQQNVQLTLQYPANGTGAVISFVRVLVNQSSDIGRAYVLSGGIGLRHITVIVEALNTNHLSYVCEIYGK